MYVTDSPSGVQRGRNSPAVSKVSRDILPLPSSRIQMSSPELVARPIATRLPSSERDQPLLPSAYCRVNVHAESTGVLAPERSIHMSLDWPASPPAPPRPCQITVPLGDTAKLGMTPPTSAMPLSAGTGGPRMVSEARSNGTRRSCPARST